SGTQPSSMMAVSVTAVPGRKPNWQVEVLYRFGSQARPGGFERSSTTPSLPLPEVHPGASQSVLTHTGTSGRTGTNGSFTPSLHPVRMSSDDTRTTAPTFAREPRC